MAISVRDNTIASDVFKGPSVKAGVPHLIAPEMVLKRTLTARIHLDSMTEENGPLRVIPGSHMSAAEMSRGELTHVLRDAVTIICNAGDVLLMRPLLSHGSRKSTDAKTQGRRVLHLEFAGSSELPGGFEWYEFHPLACE